ncbi:MAG: EF-hand domain-containing protein [Verrucomicrobiales bacterium]
MKLRKSIPALALAAASSLIVSCSTVAPFDVADGDDNENVSQDEFDRYVLEAIFTEADTNGDSKITFEEWRAANPDANKSKFKLPDSNGDSAVSPKELEGYFDREGKLVDLFNKIDTNNDGELDHAELQAFRDKMAAQGGSTKLQNLSRAASK